VHTALTYNNKGVIVNYVAGYKKLNINKRELIKDTPKENQMFRTTINYITLF